MEDDQLKQQREEEEKKRQKMSKIAMLKCKNQYYLEIFTYFLKFQKNNNGEYLNQLFKYRYGGKRNAPTKVQDIFRKINFS